MANERTAPQAGGRPMNRKHRKVCAFCVDKVEEIDYKDTAKLRRFTSDRAKILPRRVTGTCAYHQRELTKTEEHVTLLFFLTLQTDFLFNQSKTPVPRYRNGHLFCLYFQTILP